VAVAMAIESSGIGPRLQIPVDFRLEFWFRTWFWLFLGLECYDWGFAALPVFEWCIFTYWPIWMPPHCKADLIWSRRACVSFL
jgi:hypothetical protein